MKRLIIMTSVFFGTLLIGSAFTGRKPFDGLSISLIGGLSIFTILFYCWLFKSKEKQLNLNVNKNPFNHKAAVEGDSFSLFNQSSLPFQT
ncbi:hypothetical protein ACSNPA_002491 [Listeria monocytogenes]